MEWWISRFKVNFLTWVKLKDLTVRMQVRTFDGFKLLALHVFNLFGLMIDWF